MAGISWLFLNWALLRLSGLLLFLVVTPSIVMFFQPASVYHYFFFFERERERGREREIIPFQYNLAQFQFQLAAGMLPPCLRRKLNACMIQQQLFKLCVSEKVKKKAREERSRGWIPYP